MKQHLGRLLDQFEVEQDNFGEPTTTRYRARCRDLNTAYTDDNLIHVRIAMRERFRTEFVP